MASQSLMWKLLRKHISKTQLVGFSLANLVGLSIVLMAVQFYQDVLPVFGDEESFISKDYLIVTRNITSAGAMMGGNAEFAEQQIADIEAQPWCRQVGRFTASEFGISATIGTSGNRAMRTQFFFESIPAQFIDVPGAQWAFDPARPEVPVIVSRDYLSLYNFGFAAAQGMPQISEGQAGSIPLNFTFTGNGLSEVMRGRIVGFSNRLNTVIVPSEFMQWANKRYGQGTAQQPLRIIVEVNRPGDPAIADYMQAHRYDVAGDKASSGKAYYFLTLIITIVIAVGVIISLLSFFVLMLSIYLLLQKNTRKLRDLLVLGYSPAQVSAPYIKMVLAVNAAVLVLSLLVLLAVRGSYMPALLQMGAGAGSMSLAVTALVALAIMAAITTGNIVAIRRKINSLWIQR